MRNILYILQKKPFFPWVLTMKSISVNGHHRAAAILAVDSRCPEPRVEMFGIEFRWGKTKVFNPSVLKMAAV